MSGNNINLNFINNRQIFKSVNVPNQPVNSQPAQASQQAAQTIVETSQQIASQNLQASIMGGAENAAFIKDVMKLPSNFNAFIYIMQHGMSTVQLNSQLSKYLSNMPGLTQTQAQILAQLKGFNGAELFNAQGVNQNILSQLEAAIKKLPISSGGMINISDISAFITSNGKEAITQLIISMANSANNGLNNINQLKDAARLINASVAVAAQGDNAQTLKILMLLYLPWLPLQQGVDFDLEICSQDDEVAKNSVLVIRIQTVNYGEIVAILTLINKNSVDIDIQCSEEFPRDELTLRMNTESKNYSVQSTLNYTSKTIDKTSSDKARATINMSNTNEINPYLLLTAHLIIRYVVEIDKK